MIYDGLFIKAELNEIRNILIGEHISKIIERSIHEVNIYVRKNGKDNILTISANPNFPHICIESDDIDNGETPPAFCMILRKYLKGGKFVEIKQVNNLNGEATDTLERVIDFNIENIDEQGDINTYHLFIEIMGKYSNIILTDKSYTILDVLKKDNNQNARLHQKSIYSLKEICNKKEIFSETDEGFEKAISSFKALCEINNEKYDLRNALAKVYAGISTRSIEVDDNDSLSIIKEKLKTRLNSITNPNQETLDYIEGSKSHINDSSEKKNVEATIKTLFNKLTKKLDIIKSDISKCEDFEKYNTYAELISSFGYDSNNIKDNFLICQNYKDNDATIKIPLNKDQTIPENIEHYYNRYNKLKRTKEKASELLIEVNEKLDHLKSINDALLLTYDKHDIYLIKEEILEYFDEAKKSETIKKQKTDSNKRKNSKKSILNYNIHHYKSSSGIDIYVGKNNLQNEYLTFTMANPMDTWLHIKGATGSHVIIKKPYESLDDKTLIEAASIAAFFSERKNETKATVDYTYRKELKKVKGKAPGFCIYHKNFSINVRPELTLKEI